MKTILTAIALTALSCSSTTFYREGKPVARFEGDMQRMVFSYGADGAINWSGDIDHSTPTKAYGTASKGRIAAAAGVAAYGLSKIK